MDTSSVDSVCFTRKDFNTYAYILLFLSIFILYALYQQKECLDNVNLSSHLSTTELQEKVIELQDKLYSVQLDEQRCKQELNQTISKLNNSNVNTRVEDLNKIYNPLVSPDRTYNNPIVTVNNQGSEFHMIGYLYKGSERYPLFGRFKYPGRSDRWDYYAIDETRNRLKIPFKSTNDNELYDNDIVNLPTIGNDFNVKIYDYEQYRYNPNL